MGDKIAKLPSVRDVIPGLADVISFEDAGLYGVLVQGWGARVGHLRPHHRHLGPGPEGGTMPSR